jgi:hypothetical protein
MKFYGDLLKVIPFKNNTKLTILKSSKQINFCARFAFLKFIFNHFVDYSEFIKFDNKLKRCIYKLKNVIEIDKLSWEQGSDVVRLTALPKSLTHLQFGIKFNQTVNNLPKSLTHLQFEFDFNQTVDHLPKSLTHLQFGWKFNQKVDHLPSSLTHLKFGWLFNQKVDKLPKSLTHLKLGDYFNQKVDNLPKSLTHLQFGYWFNQKVDHLSSSLTHIQFGNHFNQKVDHLFMDNTTSHKPIKIIKFHENYKHLNYSLDHLKNVLIKYYSY